MVNPQEYKRKTTHELVRTLCNYPIPNPAHMIVGNLFCENKHFTNAQPKTQPFLEVLKHEIASLDESDVPAGERKAWEGAVLPQSGFRIASLRPKDKSTGTAEDNKNPMGEFRTKIEKLHEALTVALRDSATSEDWDIINDAPSVLAILIKKEEVTAKQFGDQSLQFTDIKEAYEGALKISEQLSAQVGKRGASIE